MVFKRKAREKRLILKTYKLACKRFSSQLAKFNELNANAFSALEFFYKGQQRELSEKYHNLSEEARQTIVLFNKKIKHIDEIFCTLRPIMSEHEQYLMQVRKKQAMVHNDRKVVEELHNLLHELKSAVEKEV